MNETNEMMRDVLTTILAWARGDYSTREDNPVPYKVTLQAIADIAEIAREALKHLEGKEG